MQSSDLMEYLGMLVDMERDIILQSRLIAQIENEVSKLNLVKRQYGEPVPPSDEMESFTEPNWIGGGFLFILGMFLILGLFLAFGISIEQIFIVFLIFIGAIIFAAIILISNILNFVEKNKQMKEQIKAQWKKYEQEKEEYLTAIACEQKRLDVEAVKKSILMDNLSKLKSKHEQSKKILQNIYSANIIYPKYRNFAMLCSLYEYFVSGRCDTLGYEGAYNKLDLEIRLDHIITQLDRIIQHLDEIKDNQYTLYTAIQETSQQYERLLASTNQMVNRLQDINMRGEELNVRIADLQRNSQLTAYQSERIQKELNYMNRMNYFTGKYDGVYFNRPPM